MFKAQDIMTRNVVTVRPETPVKDAILLLVEKGVTGLPVVSEDGSLVGMVSEKDMLKVLYEATSKTSTVGEMMTTNLVCFEEWADLTDICECLIQNSFRRVPILKDGRLTGVVSRSDLMRFILRARYAINR